MTADETFTPDDLVFLTFVENGVIPSEETVITAAEMAWEQHARAAIDIARAAEADRVRAAVNGLGNEFGIPVAPPVEDNMSTPEPGKHASWRIVATMLLAIAAAWVLAIILLIFPVIGFIGLGWSWCGWMWCVTWSCALVIGMWIRSLP